MEWFFLIFAVPFFFFYSFFALALRLLFPMVAPI